MSRRVRLPAADDLFRPTAGADETAAPPPAVDGAPRQPGSTAPEAGTDEPPTSRRGSGRVRHDEKMTVYITSEELLAIEHARLGLRGEYGLAVDRGRLVRAAVAIALADLDERGSESDLVRRLTG